MLDTHTAKVAVVVPSNRPSQMIEFLDRWKYQFQEAAEWLTVYFIEDSEEYSEVGKHSFKLVHKNRDDIRHDLKELASIIPTQTDCIRSYGFWLAYKDGCDVIISMDDDVYPYNEYFIHQHVSILLGENKFVVKDPAWESTVEGFAMRGAPYYTSEREFKGSMLNHGLWTNVPDLDAPSQLIATSRIPSSMEQIKEQILNEEKLRVTPRGTYFSMCGMNIAFRSELTPAMYFLLMGGKYPFDRFGDIWCGVIIKKICDHLNYAVTTGRPLVEHSRMSNVFANLKKEAPGLEVNETLWQWIDELVLTERSVSYCYEQVARHIAACPFEAYVGYFKELSIAMLKWVRLF